MSVSRQIWGPRELFDDTPSTLFTTLPVIDIADNPGFAYSNEIVIRQGQISFTTELTDGLADTRVVLEIQWSHDNVTFFTPPEPDDEIMGDVGTDTNNIFSVCTPGGVRFARLRVRVTSGDENTNLIVQAAGEYIL